MMSVFIIENPDTVSPELIEILGKAGIPERLDEERLLN